MAIHEASKVDALPIPKWREALNHFAIIFPKIGSRTRRAADAKLVPNYADTKRFTGPV